MMFKEMIITYCEKKKRNTNIHILGEKSMF